MPEDTDSSGSLNWVQRRVRRARILKTDSAKIWQDARAAIENCCDSYQEHYPDLAKIEKTRENGIRIRLTITFDTGSKVLLVEFEKNAPVIEVTLDNGGPRKFKIDADHVHAFVTDQQSKEISFDEFAEMALESALFDIPRPAPPPRNSGGDRSHGGAGSWMGN